MSSDGREVLPFDPPLVAASLSGEADAEWASALEGVVGCAFLGGVALDPASRAAARDLMARDRSEFLPPDPVAFVEEQLTALAEVDLRAGINLRSATVEPVRAAAAMCATHDAIAEVNAHCRQPELCAVGCGEALLADTSRLSEYVAAAADTGATVSVKVRAEVPGVDLAETTRAVVDAGATVVHVDAMDTESAIAEVAEAARDHADDRITVIANNEVRDRESVREYLEYGADAVSVGRPTAPGDDRAILDRVATAVAELAEEGDREEVSP